MTAAALQFISKLQTLNYVFCSVRCFDNRFICFLIEILYASLPNKYVTDKQTSSIYYALCDTFISQAIPVWKADCSDCSLCTYALPM